MDCSISYLFETLIQGEKLELYTPSKHKENKTNHKKIHHRYKENLKLQLHGCKIEPFENNLAICISNGQEIQLVALQGLLHASELGDQKYSNFVKGRLVERRNIFIWSYIKVKY